MKGWTPSFGYLSVDLFFLLSGFVLAHAYESRLAVGMKAREFLYLRVIRLFPLYLIGLILGVCTAPLNIYLDDVTFFSVGLHVIPNLFGLPGPEIEGFQTASFRPVLFPLNVAFWSLFFEFWVANIAYGFAARRLNQRALLLVIAACGAALVASAKAFHTLDMGASWHTLIGGFSRVGFSFFCGVAVYRLRLVRPPKASGPSWLFAMLLLLALCAPFEGRLARLHELVCVLVLFPLLIYFGADALEKRPRLGELLGDASYAL